MNHQERLDKLENLILSAGGGVKIFNLMSFQGNSQELTQIEYLLGEALEQVLELKKDLGCTSTLSIVEKEAQ